jgi:hypothetical protein
MAIKSNQTLMAIRTNQELTRLQQENVNAYKLIKVEGKNTKKVA